MTVEIVTILDTETDAPDPKTCRLLEVACVVYSVSHAAIARCSSTLVRAESNAAEAVNGIPPSLVQNCSLDPGEIVDRIAASANRTDAILAHNASFDEEVLRRHAKDRRFERPWVCTMDDIQWPRISAGKSLTAIALAHGVGVVHAHRALPDCLTIAALLSRLAEMGHDVSALLERGLRPKGLFVVADTRFDEARNRTAKEFGFKWNELVPQAWARRMAIEDSASLPFQVRRVEA